MRSAAYWTAVCSLIGLICLCLLWESILAPLRPGGSPAMLKAVPLLAPLFGVLRARTYTYQWASLLITAYFSEGVVRGWADTGLSQRLAWMEIALSLAFFGAALAFVRLGRRTATP